MSVSIDGAAQVLRPPRGGLPYLRHDRAGELTLEPARSLDGGRIAGWAPTRRARQVDATRLRGRPGLRRLPHAPAVRRLARGGVRAEGDGRAVRGDRARRRRDRGVGAGARRGVRRRGARAGARRSRREMLAHGTTTFEGKTRLRAVARGRDARAAARPRARRARRPADAASPALFAHAVPAGFDADAWMDEVEALAPRVRRRRARHLRRVGRVHQRAPRADGRARARARPATARARRAVRHARAPCRSRWSAGARSVDHLSLHATPTTSRRWRPPSAPPCCCPAPSCWAPSAMAPGRDARRRGRDLRARDRPQPGHLAGRLDAARSSASPCAATAGACARRCSAVDAQRRVGAAAGRDEPARSRWASAPTCSCSTGRPSTSRTASATTRSRRRVAGGELAWRPARPGLAGGRRDRRR